MAVLDNGMTDQLPSLDTIIARCEHLLDEVNQFKSHAATSRFRQTSIPMRDFEGGIQSELNHVQKVADNSGCMNSSEAARTTRSNNLTSYELIWATAKHSRGVTAFRQWHRLYPSSGTQRQMSKFKRAKRALADIIAEDGLEWIKVSSTTEKRLLHDFAKEGWGRFQDEFEDEGFGSEEEDKHNDLDQLDLEDDHERPQVSSKERSPDHEEVPDIPILSTARHLLNAARANRVRGRIPTVHIVLPRLTTTTQPETSLLLSHLRKLGCKITLGHDIPDPDPPIASVLDTMPVDPFARLSPIVNIDCTILISLISDISHVADLQPQEWYNTMLREQLKFERKEALLPSILYPVLRGRKLLTTETAAKQCKAIVETIGNDAEKARWRALLDTTDKTSALEKLRSKTDHETPGDLELPICIVREDEIPAGAAPRSPISERLLGVVGATLSGINRSVFLFGWRTGFSTISSNNNMVREIENLLEENRAVDGSEDDVAAPETWVCLPRSVVGKYDEVRQSRKERKGLSRELLFDNVGGKKDA